LIISRSGSAHTANFKSNHTMEFDNLLHHIEEGIATIKINRPKKLNALDIQTIQELDTAIRQYLDDSSTDGIIITGEGEKAFAAGADIAEFSEYTPSQAKEMAENTRTVFQNIENATKPVVAAINGFALGGGCELAMACHMRVATSNARLGQPEVGLGLIPGYGGTQRMTQLIGKTKALEFLLTGDMITAAQAENLQLINKMVEPGELEEYCYQLIQKIQRQSPMAVAKIIRAVNSYYREAEDGFETETQEFANSFGTGEFKEGVSSFLNKQKPDFKRQS
jgi:enoyl-CoA hydratase